MNFKHLETFIAVVEWNSFSEAAKKLYLTQPTISTHISQLEAELNIKLIQRTTKKLTVTKDGKEFYKYAKSISRIVDSIEDTFSLKDESKITIGCSSLPASFILPRIISDQKVKNLISTVNILVGDSESTIDGILGGTINLGIVGFMSSSRDLKYEKFMSDKLIVVTPANEKFKKLKESKVNIKTILKEPIILREQGSGTRRETFTMLESMGIDRNELKVAADVNDSETIKNLIKYGFGISIMSAISVEKEINSGELLAFNIDDLDAHRNFYFVYRSQYSIPEPLKEIIKLTKKEFSKSRS